MAGKIRTGMALSSDTRTEKALAQVFNPEPALYVAGNVTAFKSKEELATKEHEKSTKEKSGKLAAKEHRERKGKYRDNRIYRDK